MEREITLHHLDRGWEEHLGFVAQPREGIHLVRIGGLRPLEQFHRRIAKAFWELQEEIDRRIVATFDAVEVTAEGIDADKEGLRGPSSTWTYLVNDRALSDLHEMLVGSGNFALAAVAALWTGPLMVAVALWQRFKKRKAARTADLP